ncbi:uncharacterized protein LOC127107060 [Lathyrus oleraceus]|uniref:uncharacterized protein LOC127107060 n=1 Tax=Pisum sativum TaxID=3888 RepID=UPI0021D27BCD|nr:uncharacterized protein LOC127107060 [Pisum sativum]
MDGGGEYVSNEFGMFCDKEGSIHDVVPPYTPQQNGVAERKNRSIMNMMRNMLKGKSFPKELWGEAIKDLNNISLEQHFSSLSSREIELEEDEPQKRGKSVALKSKPEKIIYYQVEEESEGSDEDSEDDDGMSLILNRVD